MTRAKAYLMVWLKDKVTSLRPEDLNLSNNFEVKYVGEGKSDIQIKIKHPVDGVHYFTIKVTEHI